MASNSNDQHDAPGVTAQDSMISSPPSAAELPFLVTHWLTNYQGTEYEEMRDREKEEAIERLRNATSEVAAAFSALGAYGTSNQPMFGPQHNATYSDMARQWHPVAPNHLESLVQAAASATVASESSAPHASTNLFLAAHESHPNASGGRRLDENLQATSAPVAMSLLHAPCLLGPLPETRVIATPKDGQRQLSVSVESDYSRVGERSAQAMRDYLSLREQCQSQEVEIRNLQQSIVRQERLKVELEIDRATTMERIHSARGNAAGHEQSNEAALLSDKLEETQQGLMNAERVIAQNTRKLTELETLHSTKTEELTLAKAASNSLYSKLMVGMRRFRDPFQRHLLPSIPLALPLCGSRNSRTFLDTIARQHGGSWGPGTPRRVPGVSPSDESVAQTRKSILANRLAYAITVSAHLSFPIFCLRFDRTGRYFVTGADDCLVKVFYIGAAKSNATTKRTLNLGANDRSAILVCTLRGHAGVICDIDVSSDNTFLATASDDGDCRIWGLKDGTPIAILRGHKDGANMVSWSALTPFRLVTTSSDGLSRMWDIRQAALNRYATHVGRRPDYCLPPPGEDSRTENVEPQSLSSSASDSTSILASNVILPPLPMRNSEASTQGQAQMQEGANASAPLRSVAVNAIEGAHNAAPSGAQQPNAENIQPGQFVFNDILDEGVRLVAKLQHGAPLDDNLPGAGTRSRRKAVRVLCIARCPKGGHFATGADDGVCRVWSEEDGGIIEKVDRKILEGVSQKERPSVGRRSARVQQQSEGRLLAEFVGHMNSITDLHYSNAGDRILTASQKDGVARVWSWTESHVDGTGRFENVKQILLQVKKPESSPSGSGAQSSRQRTGSAGGGNASCDVAVWTADDARIVTSQSTLVKPPNPEIVEGSQFLLVWDSRNGQCLIGISAAHSAQVPVLVPHPTVPSILCSAGADGFAKVWDLERGECIFQHENKIDFGPIADYNEQRKCGAYQDGAFSPDGLSLVLTDDNGRFTLFTMSDPNSEDMRNTLSSSRRQSSSSDQESHTPSWMKEQYFANDYYELFFDTNGYCVERGSGQPPHLAPRAARCSFTGAPWAETVNDAFASFAGPLPLPEDVCARNREAIRSMAVLAGSGSALPANEGSRASVITYFDRDRTILIDGKSNSIVSLSTEPSPSERVEAPLVGPRHAGGRRGTNQRNTSTTGRRLSDNYRWRDYDDILSEEAGRQDEEDSNDEDFVAPTPRQSAADEDLSEEFWTDESDDSMESRASRPRRRSSHSRSNRARRRGRDREQALRLEGRSRAQPTRVSARQLTRDPDRYDESDSDGVVEEFLSTNNTPSGPYISDYNVAGHFFRLPDSGPVMRQWLRRVENRTSHNGVKNYAPQVGDTVVYIPRAHYETIKAFPTLDAPWKHFPRSARWPVVRCLVKDVRYRFPYEQYYPSRSEPRCRSLVAILTLEVTGIPELSHDRLFPWPKASFVTRQTRLRAHEFEVSMFESDFPEFIISESLFKWRLESLESTGRRTRGVSVVAYFAEESTRPRRSREDVEMTVYPGKIEELLPNSEREPDEHLLNSGYGTLNVSWDADGDNCILSPWEVTLKDKVYEAPDPPSLDDSERRIIANALTKIEMRSDVKEFFLLPVDERRYTDYSNRVEVPMDFSFIKERLAAGYYSNPRSVLADARLIRDNCIKYNGMDDLSQSASEIYVAFELEINSILEEARQLDSASLQAQEPSSRTTRYEQHGEEAPANRSSRRGSIESGTSSLERLPMPPQRVSARNSSGRDGGRRIEEQTGRRSTRAQAVETMASTPVTRSRAVDEVEPDEPNGEISGSSVDSSRESGGEPEASQSDRDDGGYHTPEEPAEDDTSEVISEYESEEEMPSKRRTAALRSRRSPRQSPRRACKRVKPSTGEDARYLSKEDEDEEEALDSEDVSDDSSDAALGSPRRSSRRTPVNNEVTASSRRSPRMPSQRKSRASARNGKLSSITRTESRPARRSGSSKPSGDAEYSPRRSSRALPKKSMADVSHSEVEEDEDTAGEEKESVASLPKKKAPKKRAASTQRLVTASPKAKRPRGKRSEGTDEIPNLKQWPDIELKKITQVAKAVLSQMAKLDEDGWFASPVIEQYPHMKKDYLSVIDTPMDFRTIEEERIPAYESISQLQEDLVLVFSNCFTYNKDSPEIYSPAIALWSQIDAVFRNACKEQNVLLPRRW